MPFKQGINFRETLGWVTDGPDEYAQTGSAVNYPITSPQGHNVGYETLSIATSPRNRVMAIDVRVAGGHFFASGHTFTYRIDLTAAGTYKFRMGLSDQSYDGERVGVALRDDTTALATLRPVVDTSYLKATVIDATNVVRATAAEWATDNVMVEHTWASTICRIDGSSVGGFSNQYWSHFYMEEVAGGVTGSLTVTEDFDSFTTVGKSVVTGSFTMAGATDVPSIDVHSVVRGSVDYTDVQDVLAATAHAVSLGNLAIGGSDDTFEISEDVVAINIHLDDNRDIASLSGKTPSSDSIAMVDTTDSVMIQGGYVAKGSLTVVDSVDKLRLRSDEQLLFDLWINDIVRTALIENDLSLQYNDGLVEFFVRETGLSPFLAFNDLLHAYLVQVTGLGRTLSLNDLIFAYVGLLEV